MSSCTLTQGATNETYAPNPFENTGNIKFYHNNVPRLGNTNEVLNLLQGTSGQQQEYTQGLLSTPILLAVITMTWMIVLWVFKCCSSKNHDWLAGKPVVLQEEPSYRKHEIDLENSSADEPNWEVSVFKTIQGSRTGLRLGRNRKGDLIAVRVDEKGIFYGRIRQGQRIISIHGNSPEENDEESNYVGHDSTISSKAKAFIKKTMKSETQNDKVVKRVDKVAEGMRTLKDSVGKVTVLVLGLVLKQDFKYAQWRNECDRVLWQKTVFMSIVSFSLLALFFTGIVLSFTGVNRLESAIDTGVGTIDIVGGKLRKGVQLLDDASRLSQSINSNVNSLLVSLNEICPAQMDQICSNLNDPSSCQSLNGLSIVSKMQQAISYLQDDSLHEKAIQDARSALDNIATQTSGLDSDLDPVSQALDGVLALAIIVILVSMLLYVVLFLPIPAAARSALFCLSYGFLFVIILFSFLLLLVILPVSSAVGDVCYDDPGSRIESILRESMDASTSDQIEDMIFNIFKGCSAPDARFDETIDFQTEGVFGNLDEAIAQLKLNIAICGTPPSTMANLEAVLNDGVDVYLCEASNILTKFSDLFSCRFWHPIYAQLAHETLCYQGMDALSAITNALFVILCMSLLIMTFRVALWDAVSSPLQQASEDKEKEDPYKIMKTGSKKQTEDFSSVENTIPMKKDKKKNKRKPKHMVIEESMDVTADESREFNAEGLEEAHEGEGEVPQTRKKKVHKKKKKRDSDREGERVHRRNPRSSSRDQRKSRSSRRRKRNSRS